MFSNGISEPPGSNSNANVAEMGEPEHRPHLPRPRLALLVHRVAWSPTISPVRLSYRSDPQLISMKDEIIKTTYKAVIVPAIVTRSNKEARLIR
jgi:hypothetical protein